MEDSRTADGSLKVAIAMLVGITFESSFAAGVTAAQIAIAPPLGAVPFFVLNATYAVVFLPLLWWRHTAGYVGAIGVGAFSILTLLLLLSGSLGEFTPGNPLGPLTLFVLAVILIVSTIKAWRRRSRQVGGSASAPAAGA